MVTHCTRPYPLFIITHIHPNKHLTPPFAPFSPQTTSSPASGTRFRRAAPRSSTAPFPRPSASPSSTSSSAGADNRGSVPLPAVTPPRPLPPPAAPLHTTSHPRGNPTCSNKLHTSRASASAALRGAFPAVLSASAIRNPSNTCVPANSSANRRHDAGWDPTNPATSKPDSDTPVETPKHPYRTAGGRGTT